LGDWSYCEFIWDMFNICSSYWILTLLLLTFLANE
jgi:hypothetical protein